ncbi:DUF4253 domain-containing protein [Mycobacterium talmoniae]|uniref:DUF4253 domain-containing protein n=1 Tax=Mycobacterium talmoniae TaxID=1858794 RepID=A0A1S1NJY3_9MYCO|nr:MULTISPECIES: DUF4253 domain-containing protein [Mycobacterium]OHV06517.1 hypothetical protein BKN37_01780 [Mycobacterium talmoniae]PQM46222.1 hypothetical protein C1Y40_03608 [Mycobacterium talmoniae]TDH56106.1 DUF4253 domain-containing protein [Mycobacterium eburneum]
MTELGTAAAAILAASRRWPILPGLTDAELAAIESRFRIRFSADHRAFLGAGLPSGPSWPDWRAGDEMLLRQHLGLPARSLLQAVERDGFWHPGWGARPLGEAAVSRASEVIATAPRLLPVYGHAFMAGDSDAPGAPVWSIDGAAVRLLGDLREFIELLCTQRAAPEVPWESAAAVEFWRELLPNAPQPDPEYFPPLGVPPFRSDPTVSVPAPVAPPPEPAEAFAARGMNLVDVTRHDGVLLFGMPLWTASVEPGPDAAAGWESARALFPHTGLWPVLITERTWHRIGEQGVPGPVNLLSAELDGARWLARRFAAATEDEPMPRSSAGDFLRTERPDWRSDWARGYDVDRYRQLALVPAPAQWLVPGLLQWSGAVNYDVAGLEHATMLRRWFGRWATELVALDNETMTLRAGKPPVDPATALQCAVEAYLYCPDTLDPHPDGVDVLTPWLTGPLWSFWWD